MSRQGRADKLDQQIDQLLRARDGLPGGEPDSLLSIAEELRQIPRAAFRNRLRANLMKEVESRSPLACLYGGDGSRLCPPDMPIETRDHCDPRVGGALLAETLPGLAGTEFRLFPVDHRSFVFSFLSHTALIALITSGIVLWKRPITESIKAVSQVTYLSPGHGGGGSGRRSPTPVRRGTPPAFSDQQLSSPIILETHPTRLPVPPTLIGPPDVRLPESTQIGDLMASAIPLPSNGSGSGGAMGNALGTGLGGGIGPGLGVGREGGFGDGSFSKHREVVAPRAIYSPDPEYSEGGRKTKQQGTVVLSLIVDPDGRARDIRIVRSLGMGLDEKAVEALRKWRFEPGRRAGVRVAMQVNVEVSFKLY